MAVKLARLFHAGRGVVVQAERLGHAGGDGFGGFLRAAVGRSHGG